jgi:hypothetical protein
VELTGRENENTAPPGDPQQTLVARHDDARIRRECRGEKHLVVGIGADPLGKWRRVHDGRRDRKKCQKGSDTRSLAQAERIRPGTPPKKTPETKTLVSTTTFTARDGPLRRLARYPFGGAPCAWRHVARV